MEIETFVSTLVDKKLKRNRNSVLSRPKHCFKMRGTTGCAGILLINSVTAREECKGAHPGRRSSYPASLYRSRSDRCACSPCSPPPAHCPCCRNTTTGRRSSNCTSVTLARTSTLIIAINTFNYALRVSRDRTVCLGATSTPCHGCRCPCTLPCTGSRHASPARGQPRSFSSVGAAA